MEGIAGNESESRKKIQGFRAIGIGKSSTCIRAKLINLITGDDVNYECNVDQLSSGAKGAEASTHIMKSWFDEHGWGLFWEMQTNFKRIHRPALAKVFKILVQQLQRFFNTNIERFQITYFNSQSGTNNSRRLLRNDSLWYWNSPINKNTEKILINTHIISSQWLSMHWWIENFVDLDWIVTRRRTKIRLFPTVMEMLLHSGSIIFEEANLLSVLLKWTSKELGKICQMFRECSWAVSIFTAHWVKKTLYSMSGDTYKE